MRWVTRCRQQELLAAAVAVGLHMAEVPLPIARLLLQHSVERPRLLTPALLRSQLSLFPEMALTACKVGPGQRGSAVVMNVLMQNLEALGFVSALSSPVRTCFIVSQVFYVLPCTSDGESDC